MQVVSTKKGQSERLVKESEAHVIVLLLGLLLLLLLLGRRLSSRCRSSTTGSSGSRSSCSTTTHAGELGETSGDQLLSGLALAGSHHLGQPLFVRLYSDRGENLLHVGGGDLVFSHGAEQSSSCSLGDSESGYQAPPCYKLQTFPFFNSPTPRPTYQDGHVQDQAELPRGLRGVDQQADQHGILCLLRLSLHELLLQPRRPSPAWFRRSLQEGVERGARPRHEVDAVPDQEGRSCRLPGHRQADHDGLGQPAGSHGGRARA